MVRSFLKESKLHCGSDEETRRRLAAFEAVSAPRKAVRAVLVTPFGIERNAYSSRYSNVITFDDLFS